MPRSTYFYRKKLLEEGPRDKDVREKISNIFYGHREMYGHHKIQAVLEKKNIHINRKTVLKIMNQEEMECKYRPKKYHHVKQSESTVAPNTLDRRFWSNEPLKVLTTDVTEFSAKNGKVYLSPVLDLFNREIIAYDISFRNDSDMVMRMMERLKKRFAEHHRKMSGMMLHSDQGSLYRCGRYLITFAEEKGVARSMSNRGNCYDNAVIESLFGQMKSEMPGFRTMSKTDLAKKINVMIRYFCDERIQLSLEGMSPVEYRKVKTMKNFARLAIAAGDAVPNERKQNN